MAFQSLADVFAYVQGDDTLTSNEVLVLLAIANYTDQATGKAYPSLKTLEKATKLKRRTLQYALHSLAGKNLLQAILEPSRHTSLTYQLLIPSTESTPSTNRRSAPHAPPSTNRRSAPHARGGAPHAPNPVTYPEEREKPRARDFYMPFTPPSRDNTNQDNKVENTLAHDSTNQDNLTQWLTPGSELWHYVTTPPSDKERNGVLSSE